MKYILCLILIVICFLIAKGLSNQYKDRKQFLEITISFIDYISNEIRFRSCPIKQLCYSFDNSNILFNKTLQLYSQSLLSGEQFYLGDKEFQIFTNAERLNVEELFNCLGKYDTMSQLLELSHCRKNIEVLKDEAIKEYKKYSSLYLKLGLIIGIAISILLL